MKIGNRNFRQLYWLFSRKENYIALINFFRIYKNPFMQMMDALFNVHKYPKNILIKGQNTISFLLLNPEDMATIHAVYCREDYKINNKQNVVIDIGSNKGYTVGYFLSKNKNNFVYGYEPDVNNFKLLKRNLSQFQGRYEIYENAVSDMPSKLTFYSEKTGKYGSLEPLSSNEEILESYEVDVLGINDILEKVLSKHKRINYIKIDTEGHEERIIRSIKEKYWKKIDVIYSENSNCTEFIPLNFKRTWRYDIEKITSI